MDQKSSQAKNLDPLPESEDKEFWSEAETHSNLSWQSKAEAQREAEESRPKHYFIRSAGHEAKCTHCDWGFVLDPGDKIVDGHLYDKSGKLVI